MAHDFWVAPNENVEKAFWDYVATRQEEWYRENVVHLGTQAPEFAARRNVYREQDLFTQYCVEEIMENPEHEQFWQIVAHQITFRMLNNIGSYEEVKELVTEAAHGSEDYMMAIGITLDDMLLKKQKPFGRTMPHYEPEEGIEPPTKGERFAAMLLGAYESLNNLETLAIKDQGDISTLIRFLHQIPGMHADCVWEVVIDWMLPIWRNRSRRIVPTCNILCEEDESPRLHFEHVGIHALAGLMLMGVQGDDRTIQRALHGLGDYYKQHYELGQKRGFRSLWLGYGTSISLDGPNLLQCLGEFFKFARNTIRQAPEVVGCWKPKCITIPAYNGWLEPHYKLHIPSGWE